MSSVDQDRTVLRDLTVSREFMNKVRVEMARHLAFTAATASRSSSPKPQSVGAVRARFIEGSFGVSNFDGDVEVAGLSVERCLVFVWAADTQSGDDPFSVVLALDPGEDRQFGVVSAGPAVPVGQLGFQTAEDYFGKQSRLIPS